MSNPLHYLDGQTKSYPQEPISILWFIQKRVSSSFLFVNPCRSRIARTYTQIRSHRAHRHVSYMTCSARPQSSWTIVGQRKQRSPSCRIAAVIQRRECNDRAHQDACCSRCWHRARRERLRPKREGGPRPLTVLRHRERARTQ